MTSNEVAQTLSATELDYVALIFANFLFDKK